MGVCPPPILTDPEAPSPEGTTADLTACLSLPRAGRGATRPPQTLGDPGAVKPDTCPCTCTQAHTTTSFHGPDRWGPYTPQSGECLRSPTQQALAAIACPVECHGVRDTAAVAHSPRPDARGRGRATRPKDGTCCVGSETGLARGHHTHHSSQSSGRGAEGSIFEH